MTLHEAIEKVLLQTRRAMTTNEIADSLNKNKWYEKKDGSPITAFQIHGRTRNYSQLFNQNGSFISLVGQSALKPIILKGHIGIQVQDSSINKRKSLDVSFIDKNLMDEKKFKSAASIDGRVCHSSGIYCMRIKDKSKLPAPFNKLLAERGHNIIYIGIASTSLCSRFLNQELRANGHGTFFRSIGAVLGYRPLKGSLNNKANKRNYKFSSQDETKIIEWINKNLMVNWIEVDKDFETIENALLNKYRPLFNLAKNPSSLIQLSALRAECVKIATSF